MLRGFGIPRPNQAGECWRTGAAAKEQKHESPDENPNNSNECRENNEQDVDHCYSAALQGEL